MDPIQQLFVLEQLGNYYLYKMTGPALQASGALQAPFMAEKTSMILSQLLVRMNYTAMIY